MKKIYELRKYVLSVEWRSDEWTVMSNSHVQVQRRRNSAQLNSTV